MATHIVMRSFVNCLFVGQIATTFYNGVKKCNKIALRLGCNSSFLLTINKHCFYRDHKKKTVSVISIINSLIILILIVHQVTVMHSMQAGYMDKAQKYTDKALMQIEKLKSRYTVDPL